MKYRLLLAIALLALGRNIELVGQQYSQLWGKNGEVWTPQSRLPDFSFAGYRFGEKQMPRVNVVANVRDFGAKGDGEHDDSKAFIQAIEAVESGAILIPAGRYVIKDIIGIRKPNIVLRGAEVEKTVLLFPKPLQEILPNMGATTSGRPTSNYSWSGGFIWAKGAPGQREISPIMKNAKRGEQILALKSVAGLMPGQRVAVHLRDTREKTLLDHVYSGDPGDTAKITKPVNLRFVSRIESIEGNRIKLERPLRTDIRIEWKPVLQTYQPTVSEVGIEGLTFEFPRTAYDGHFTELGRNAIAFSGVSDSWIRNVRIRNSDSGIFLSGSRFCTVSDIVFESFREDWKGTTGHHGLTLGSDCLLENFDFRSHFIHDITVTSLQSGNVAKNGKGTNLSLDHHKKGPYENLFCNLDVGKGTDFWRCGGGAALGKHCGARETFWRIRSERDLNWPRSNFGPDSMNLVGLQTSKDSQTDPTGKWFEVISPNKLQPPDLHAAQLKRRMSEKN